jgi:hypothetical protein
MERPSLILFLSFLLCFSKATLPPIYQSGDIHSSTTNLNIPEDLGTKDLELFLKTHCSEDGSPVLTFLSELKNAIKKDPLKPHSLEVILKINQFYIFQSTAFMMIIKALDDEELVLHIALMLKKIKTYKKYKRSVKRCYLKHSYKLKPEKKVKIIFDCFDRLIRNHMKMPYPDSTDLTKDMILGSRKQFAHLVLSILQNISCSPRFKIDLSFADELPTKSHFLTMTRFIEGIIPNSLLGAKKVNSQLHNLYQKFVGKEPSKVEDREHLLTLLLLFHHYSCCIIDFEYAEVNVNRLEPSFLARLVLGKKHSDVSDFFRYFDNEKLLLNGANSFFHYHLNPVKKVVYIEDFTKRSHNIPPLPDNRKDLQWILEAYNILRLYLIGNQEIISEKDYSDPKDPIFVLLSKMAKEIQKDPLKPQSPEIILEINQHYTSHPFRFMRTLNSLFDEELILHVCLMLKRYEKYEIYVKSLKNCYLEWSFNLLPEKKNQLIFECFDELIQSQMKAGFADPEEKDIVLNTRKLLAQLMLSIIQRISFSPNDEIKISFIAEKLSTRSYFMIMSSYIEELSTNSFWGAKTANYKLHELSQKFNRNIPTQVQDCERVLILLLQFQHYSYFIVKYDFADVDLHRVEPSFLAIIALAAYYSNLSDVFSSFDHERLLHRGANTFYHHNFSTTRSFHFIYDFTKSFHNIPPIPDDREDLLWILGAYNQIRLDLINLNKPIQLITNHYPI